MSEPAQIDATTAGELLTLQRAAYVSEAQLYGDPAIPPLTQTLDELRRELADPRVTALGIRDGHRLVAAVRVRVEDNTAEVGRLIVAPDRQGQGLGTRLLREAERVTPTTVTQFHLFTGADSDANLRLYRRLGYVDTHTEEIGPITFLHLAKQR